MGPWPHVVIGIRPVNTEPGYLIAAMIWSTIGLSCCVYGKKSQRMSILIGGLALIAASYFAQKTWALCLLGLGILGLTHYFNQRED